MALSPKGKEDILIGNFIGDAIKGDPNTQLSSDIAKGVKLHRAIDQFTDQHDLNKENLKFFHSEIGKFSGIGLDIIYDHLLCKNWQMFYVMDLDPFIHKALGILYLRMNEMPPKMQGFLNMNKKFQWVENYKNLKGISLVLKQFEDHRAPQSKLSQVPLIYLQNKAEIEQNFRVFYEDLKHYVKDYY